MRVVGGSAKGRKLLSVPGESTRPILDRVKTALFDILRPSLDGVRMLDLFAGTGGVGIEALSQGAEHCTFLDLDARAIKILRENLKTTQLADKAEVRHTDAFSFLRASKQAFDLIYIAPPQYQALWNQALYHIAERPALLKPGARLIVQIDPREYEAVHLTGIAEVRQKRYGNTLLVFFEQSDSAPQEQP